MTLWLFLMQMVMLLGGAFILGTLAQRLRQSPIIGYLMAGTIIGPLLFNPDAINQTAELGVSLLLFSIGLEFSIGRLRSMGRMAFGGGTLQVLLTLALVTLVMATQVELPQALSIGAIVTLSSTAVVMRVLVDRSEIDSVRGRSCLAILLLQDIAIVPLVIMVGLLTPAGSDISIVQHIFKVDAAAVGLAVILYLVLYWGVPVLLSSKGMFANRELSILLACTVGMGAAWAAHTLGVSPALGAFMAGMLLGESPFAVQIQADIGSLRTIMVTLFFASVGMLAKPLFFVGHAHWVLLAAVVIFSSKAAIVYLVTRLFGLNHRHGLATGISLGQIGEFSFVLAAEARQGGILEIEAFDLIVSATIVLMFASPYMVALAFPLADRLTRRGLAAKDMLKPSSVEPINRVLVVGLGPSGRQVVHSLKENLLEPIIIDVNPVNRSVALKMVVQFYPGDASSEEVLLHAGLAEVCMAVITVPDTRAVVAILEAIRRLRPLIPIAVRCRYNRHLKDLEAAGADIIVDEETRIGHTLALRILDYMKEVSGDMTVCRLAGQIHKDKEVEWPAEE